MVADSGYQRIGTGGHGVITLHGWAYRRSRCWATRWAGRGEHDPVLGAETMRATFSRWYPGLELEVLGNAGHYAMDETPAALATAVEEFLRRQ